LAFFSTLQSILGIDFITDFDAAVLAATARSLALRATAFGVVGSAPTFEASTFSGPQAWPQHMGMNHITPSEL